MTRQRPAEQNGANRVRDFREERLMTREEMARRARVSLRTIWSVESGYDCRVETKRAILRALSIPRRHYRLVFPRIGDGAVAALDQATASASGAQPLAMAATAC